MSQLWDIRQPVRMLAENIVRIRYQETTGKGIEDFMCAAVTVIFTVQSSEAVIVTCSYHL
jgi:hypothetical protein